jgi:malonyl CoA-acyl carrier protein transacylase
MISAGLFSGPVVDRFIAEFDPDSLRVPGLVFGAIGAGVDRVDARARRRYPGIALSHDNAPNQCIVCGPEDEIDRLMKELRKQNVLCQALPFRSGFHTPMLEPYLGPILAASSDSSCTRRRCPGVVGHDRRARSRRTPRRSASCSCATWSSRSASGR